MAYLAAPQIAWTTPSVMPQSQGSLTGNSFDEEQVTGYPVMTVPFISPVNTLAPASGDSIGYGF